jgi:hypothetical protein
MVDHQRHFTAIANQIDTQQLPCGVTRRVGAPVSPSVRMDDPLRVRVRGRAGAGRRTVARALRGAGVAVVESCSTADIEVYVFVETLNDDDRAALAAAQAPTIAVLTAVHRSCALDASRAALRRWAQAGGRPSALT